MEIGKINEEYLSGLIDMALVNFSINNTHIPEELKLNYVIKTTDIGNEPSENAARITFYWKTDENIDEESNLMEEVISSEGFVIVKGEAIAKILFRVEELLERLTC